MKDKKALLILIPFLLFVIIVGALAIVGDRIPDNPPEPGQVQQQTCHTDHDHMCCRILPVYLSPDDVVGLHDVCSGTGCCCDP